MAAHFSLGSINKNTKEYDYPQIASNLNMYCCPSCENDVILKKGKIKRPHYCHKQSKVPCFYFEKPTDSEIHKDAKLLMKKLLDSKKSMYFNKRCNMWYNSECSLLGSIE
jgi:competence CoiA-like predicted nuclease